MEKLPTSGASLEPVAGWQRIESLDVLRGVALLGIVVINIQMYAMIWVAYSNPTAYGDLHGANYAVWLLGHVLADHSFLAIFTMLFGAGIVHMSARCRAAGRAAAGLHYRRMGLLLVFGLLHGHLLWYGDILYHYAICGAVAYLFRNLRPRRLLVLGGLALAVASGLMLFWGLVMSFQPQEVLDQYSLSWAPTQARIAEETAAYQAGWLGQMGHRVPMAVFYETAELVGGIGWRVFGFMLAGMALFKLEVLSARRSTALYLAMIAAAVCIGVPVIMYSVHQKFAAGWEWRYSFYLGGQYDYWAGILVSLGWLGLVALVCKRGAWPAITRRLAAVGRMSLTNYLLHSVICTSIFYGHGLGLFGQLERTGQMVIVLAIWAFQLVFSPVWLRYFRFGPMEWLWRSASYMKMQPMRSEGR